MYDARPKKKKKAMTKINNEVLMQLTIWSADNHPMHEIIEAINKFL